MREQIAVLDGLNGLGMSDPYTQDYSGFDSVKETTPVPGGGQNYTGGSDWFERAPYRLQQEGLAGLRGLGNPGGYAGSRTGPVPGNGQNYTGGSSWAEGFPTMPSSEGLAASLTIDEVPGWAGSSVSPVPGGGANYTGGSDWAEGFPTAISSQGLVGLASLRGVRPDMLRSWAGCGVINAIRIIGISRAMGDVSATVERVMRLGFPRRTALNAKSVSYMAALYTARQVGANVAQARSIARRASAAC